jgi:Xaa-Pro aminopeptidase
MRTLLLLLAALPLTGQPVFTNVFPPEEFAARRVKVMAQIGDSVAIVLGTTETAGETPLRQNNQFHYLCGVVEPRAVLVLDGRTKRSTLFLSARNAQRDASAYGPGLGPGAEAAAATGLEAVVDRAGFPAFVQGLVAEGRGFYTPFGAEVLGSVSQGDPDKLWANNKSDPFDGRVSREEAFRTHLKELAPKADVKDLDPLLNSLRAIKSAREIAVIREATRIAGLGIMEAMRDARPGLYEYELQAASEYVFKKYGAFGAAYFALVGTGKNTYYTHYHRDTAKLEDGDLVQYDYAPDFKNYQSDVTRVFPANGKFTAWQREYYSIYLQLYQAVIASIRPGLTPTEVVTNAVLKMGSIVASFSFTDEKIRRAAVAFVGKYRTATGLGHTVGLEVHDVRRPDGPLQPGEIFTIEPEMRIEELHLGMRLEDMLLITASGCENLSAFVPIQMRDIEKLMADRKNGLGAAHSTLLRQR